MHSCSKKSKDSNTRVLLLLWLNKDKSRDNQLVAKLVQHRLILHLLGNLSKVVDEANGRIFLEGIIDSMNMYKWLKTNTY